MFRSKISPFITTRPVYYCTQVKKPSLSAVVRLPRADDSPSTPENESPLFGFISYSWPSLLDPSWFRSHSHPPLFIQNRNTPSGVPSCAKQFCIVSDYVQSEVNQFCIMSDCMTSVVNQFWFRLDCVQSRAKQFCIRSDCTPFEANPSCIESFCVQSGAIQFCIGSDCMLSDIKQTCIRSYFKPYDRIHVLHSIEIRIRDPKTGGNDAQLG